MQLSIEEKDLIKWHCKFWKAQKIWVDNIELNIPGENNAINFKVRRL